MKLIDVDKLIEEVDRVINYSPRGDILPKPEDILKIIECAPAALPFKVGDIVYFPVEDNRNDAQITYIRIEADNIYFGWVQYDYHPECTEVWDEGEFKLSEVGKTVFIAYEEAQKALATTKENFVCPKYGNQNRDCYECQNVAYNFDGDLDCNVSGKTRKEYSQ